MELAANVWLVTDAGAGLVQRYFMRAYAIDAEDKVISMVLQTLAPTNFRAAKAFKLASSFSKRSGHGTMHGTTSISAFRQHGRPAPHGAPHAEGAGLVAGAARPVAAAAVAR